MLNRTVRWALQTGRNMPAILFFSMFMVFFATVSYADLEVEIKTDPAPDSGRMAPAEFQFDAIVKGGAAESFFWDFGDEITPETCEDETCWHEFKKYGTYTVKLTVKDKEGKEVVKTVEIKDIKKRPGCPY